MTPKHCEPSHITQKRCMICALKVRQKRCMICALTSDWNESKKQTDGEQRQYRHMLSTGTVWVCAWAQSGHGHRYRHRHGHGHGQRNRHRCAQAQAQARQGHGWTTLGGVGRDTRGSERDNRTIERWVQGIARRSTPILKMYLHSSSAT